MPVVTRKPLQTMKRFNELPDLVLIKIFQLMPHIQLMHILAACERYQHLMRNQLKNRGAVLSVTVRNKMMTRGNPLIYFEASFENPRDNFVCPIGSFISSLSKFLLFGNRKVIPRLRKAQFLKYLEIFVNVFVPRIEKINFEFPNPEENIFLDVLRVISSANIYTIENLQIMKAPRFQMSDFVDKKVLDAGKRALRKYEVTGLTETNIPFSSKYLKMMATPSKRLTINNCQNIRPEDLCKIKFRVGTFKNAQFNNQDIIRVLNLWKEGKICPNMEQLYINVDEKTLNQIEIYTKLQAVPYCNKRRDYIFVTMQLGLEVVTVIDAFGSDIQREDGTFATVMVDSNQLRLFVWHDPFHTSKLAKKIKKELRSLTVLAKGFAKQFPNAVVDGKLNALKLNDIRKASTGEKQKVANEAYELASKIARLRESVIDITTVG